MVPKRNDQNKTDYIRHSEELKKISYRFRNSINCLRYIARSPHVDLNARRDTLVSGFTIESRDRDRRDIVEGNQDAANKISTADHLDAKAGVVKKKNNHNVDSPATAVDNANIGNMKSLKM